MVLGLLTWIVNEIASGTFLSLVIAKVKWVRSVFKTLALITVAVHILVRE